MIYSAAVLFWHQGLATLPCLILMTLYIWKWQTRADVYGDSLSQQKLCANPSEHSTPLHNLLKTQLTLASSFNHSKQFKHSGLPRTHGIRCMQMLQLRVRERTLYSEKTDGQARLCILAAAAAMTLTKA